MLVTVISKSMFDADDAVKLVAVTLLAFPFPSVILVPSRVTLPVVEISASKLITPPLTFTFPPPASVPTVWKVIVSSVSAVTVTSASKRPSRPSRLTLSEPVPLPVRTVKDAVGFANVTFSPKSESIKDVPLFGVTSSESVIVSAPAVKSGGLAHRYS